MKKQFTHILSTALVLGGLSLSQAAQAQDIDTFFVETMGTGTTNAASIASTTFDNTGVGAIVISGTGDMRYNTHSLTSHYGLASGGYNVMLNASGENFNIDGIDIEGYTDLSLAIAIKKGSNAETGSNISVQVFVDDVLTNTFVPTFPTGTGTSGSYYFLTGIEVADGEVLEINVVTASASEFRIDDIMVMGTPAALPVTLLDFSARQQGQNNIFSWTTAQEKELSHFILEGSVDGKSFKAIDQVNAYNNYSGATYTQSYAQSIEKFFRLKSVDVDGSFAYSKVVMLNGVTAAQVAILNTLAQDQLTVTSPKSNIAYSIYAVSGQMIQSGVLAEGVNSIAVDQLPVGQYILHTASDNIRFTKN